MDEYRGRAVSLDTVLTEEDRTALLDDVKNNKFSSDTSYNWYTASEKLSFEKADALAQNIMNEGYMVDKILEPKDDFHINNILSLCAPEYKSSMPIWTPKQIVNGRMRPMKLKGGDEKKGLFFSKDGKSPLITATSYHSRNIRNLKEILWARMFAILSSYITHEKGYSADVERYYEQLFDQVTHINKWSKDDITFKTDSQKFLSENDDDVFFTGFLNIGDHPITLRIYEKSHLKENFITKGQKLKLTNLKEITAIQIANDNNSDYVIPDKTSQSKSNFIKETISKLKAMTLKQVTVHPGEVLIYDRHLLYSYDRPEWDRNTFMYSDGTYFNDGDMLKGSILKLGVSFRLSKSYAPYMFERNGGWNFFIHQGIPFLNNGSKPTSEGALYTKTPNNAQIYQNWCEEVFDESLLKFETVGVTTVKVVQEEMPSLRVFAIKKVITAGNYKFREDPDDDINDIIEMIKTLPEGEWTHLKNPEITDKWSILRWVFSRVKDNVIFTNPKEFLDAMVYINSRYHTKDLVMYLPFKLGDVISDKTEKQIFDEHDDSKKKEKPFTIDLTSDGSGDDDDDMTENKDSSSTKRKRSDSTEINDETKIYKKGKVLESSSQSESELYPLSTDSTDLQYSDIKPSGMNEISDKLSTKGYLDMQKSIYLKQFNEIKNMKNDLYHSKEGKENDLANIEYFLTRIQGLIDEIESSLKKNVFMASLSGVDSKQINISERTTMDSLAEKMNHLDLVHQKPSSDDYKVIGDKMVPYTGVQYLPQEGVKMRLNAEAVPIDLQVSRTMKSLSMNVPWQGTILYNPRHLGILNSKYRRVITTTSHMQVVLTSIENEMNKVVNKDTAVFVRIIRGKMKITMWMAHGVKFKTRVLDNQCIVIPAGVVYKIENGCPCSEKIPLKFLSIYSKPLYPHNLIINAKDH